MIDDPPQESDAATRHPNHITAGPPVEGDSQADHLRRVGGNIGAAVLAYCRLHRRFTAVDLHAAVAGTIETSPGSCTRILRSLRRKGLIDYVVTNRRRGEYAVTSIGEDG